jgi:hypothetical protein
MKATVAFLCLLGVCIMGCQRTVFVTESVHTGDFGGLEGADAICQAEADAAGLPGTFLAWLSDSAESPSTRFVKYNPLLDPQYPYELVDGTLVASGWVDLADGTLVNTIHLTATGTHPSGVLLAWTNTKLYGLPAKVLLDPAYDSCSDWTDLWKSGWGGQLNARDANWTLAGLMDCDATAHLYCFQQ